MSNTPQNMLRLPEVLERRKVSRSKHYADVKAGRFPRPIKLGPKINLWPEQDLIDEQQRLLATRDEAA